MKSKLITKIIKESWAVDRVEWQEALASLKDAFEVQSIQFKYHKNFHEFVLWIEKIEKDNQLTFDNMIDAVHFAKRRKEYVSMSNPNNVSGNRKA